MFAPKTAELPECTVKYKGISVVFSNEANGMDDLQQVLESLKGQNGISDITPSFLNQSRMEQHVHFHLTFVQERLGGVVGEMEKYTAQRGNQCASSRLICLVPETRALQYKGATSAYITLHFSLTPKYVKRLTAESVKMAMEMIDNAVAQIKPEETKAADAPAGPVRRSSSCRIL